MDGKVRSSRCAWLKANSHPPGAERKRPSSASGHREIEAKSGLSARPNTASEAHPMIGIPAPQAPPRKINAGSLWQARRPCEGRGPCLFHHAMSSKILRDMDPCLCRDDNGKGTKLQFHDHDPSRLELSLEANCSKVNRTCPSSLRHRRRPLFEVRSDRGQRRSAIHPPTCRSAGFTASCSDAINWPNPAQ